MNKKILIIGAFLAAISTLHTKLSFSADANNLDSLEPKIVEKIKYAMDLPARYKFKNGCLNIDTHRGYDIQNSESTSTNERNIKDICTGINILLRNWNNSLYPIDSLNLTLTNHSINDTDKINCLNQLQWLVGSFFNLSKVTVDFGSNTETLTYRGLHHPPSKLEGFNEFRRFISQFRDNQKQSLRLSSINIDFSDNFVESQGISKICKTIRYYLSTIDPQKLLENSVNINLNKRYLKDAEAFEIAQQLRWSGASLTLDISNNNISSKGILQLVYNLGINNIMKIYSKLEKDYSWIKQKDPHNPKELKFIESLYNIRQTPPVECNQIQDLLDMWEGLALPHFYNNISSWQERDLTIIITNNPGVDTLKDRLDFYNTLFEKEWIIYSPQDTNNNTPATHA